MKRILIFSLAYYPRFVGGAEVAVKEITDRLGGNFEFDMITLRFDSNLKEYERIGNVHVHRVGKTLGNPSPEDLLKKPLLKEKKYFPFMALKRARELHAKNRYDATWAIMANYAGFAALFFKFFHPRIPMLLTLQEGDPIPDIKRKVRFVYPLFILIFRTAKVVQVISTYLGKWARDMGFKGPLEVVPNAVDTKHFSRAYDPYEMDDLKKRLRKSAGDVFLITTSRLVKKNAVDDVIKALNMLPDNVHFLVLGTGPDEAKLRKLAGDEGVSERVKFLGQIEHGLLPKYLQASDIFIRPSLSEGMGNSFIEAFAAGLPVIATQEGGIADFLFDAEKNPDKEPTGFAVMARDPADIAEAVKKILADPEGAKKTAQNAQKLAFEKYDWSLIAKDMRRVFDTLFI